MVDMRQVEEKVETLDERGGQRGGRHTVDETVGTRRQQVDGTQQHPAVTRLLRRLDFQEFDNGAAGCIY